MTADLRVTIIDLMHKFSSVRLDLFVGGTGHDYLFCATLPPNYLFCCESVILCRILLSLGARDRRIWVRCLPSAPP